MNRSMISPRRERLSGVRRLIARRGLPRRLAPVVFAFYMASIMAFLMTLVITLINEGMGPGFMGRVLHAYVLAMPVAFVCVLIVRPLVVRLVALTIEKEQT